MSDEGTAAVFAVARAEGETADATVATARSSRPTLIELDRLDELDARGVRAGAPRRPLPPQATSVATIEQINATGYGLTLGVHSRIDETIASVVADAHVGNVYVNRNIVGAVVGVQPFGGEGLSGTGPKAGGPLYMTRLLSARPDDAMARALDAASGSADGTTALRSPPPAHGAVRALAQWAADTGDTALRDLCDRFVAASRSGEARVLRGPTGERNLYSLLPREAVLCLAERDADRLVQSAAAFAVGAQAVWPASAAEQLATLPVAVRDAITLTADWLSPATRFDAVIHHGGVEALGEVCTALAERAGPIVGVQSLRRARPVWRSSDWSSNARSASTPRRPAATRR